MLYIRKYVILSRVIGNSFPMIYMLYSFLSLPIPISIYIYLDKRFKNKKTHIYVEIIIHCYIKIVLINNLTNMMFYNIKKKNLSL